MVLVKCLVSHDRADTGGILIGRCSGVCSPIRGVVAQVKLVIFSHHSAFWIAVGIGELGYNIDSVVKTLDTGEVIDFGEPLFATLVVEAGDSSQTAACVGGKDSVSLPNRTIGPSSSTVIYRNECQMAGG